LSENDIERKIFNYITALENTNEELLNALKKCVEVLTHFKPHVPDQQGYQEMLDLFHETIKVGERTVEEKTYH
jgi:hypothetical protein